MKSCCMRALSQLYIFGKPKNYYISQLQILPTHVSKTTMHMPIELKVGGINIF